MSREKVIYLAAVVILADFFARVFLTALRAIT